MEKQKKIQGLSHLIGNTPLLDIKFLYKGRPRRIFAKAENLNMTGSIKDRMAFHIIKMAYQRGELKEKTTIIEATSGNSGISFTAIGRALGHPVIIFMPEGLSSERINLLKSYGADVRIISKADGGFPRCLELSEELARQLGDAFLPCQFANPDNIDDHYISTGPEIWWQLKLQNLEPDAFVAGVGTGGTVMGVGKYLKEKNKNIKIHPLEPVSFPILTTKQPNGKHRIQGISGDFIPDLLNLDELDEVIQIDDGDSIIMAQNLCSELGLGVGISSGANFIAALKVQNMLGDDSIVVTVFPDDNKKYLSTDLLQIEPVKEGFLSSDVEFEEFRSLKRVCYTCCEPKECMDMYFINSGDVPKMPHCPRRA